MPTRLLLTLLLCSVPLTAQNRPAPSATEVAPGVIVFTTPSYGDVGLDGNSIAILSRDGVLVFDTNGTPAAAEAVLAEIRKLTSQPVRWVVNSHWHWDHWYGTEVYQRAFPDLRIVAHEKTRALMIGPALEFNRPGLEKGLPGYLADLEKRAAADASLRPLLAEDRFFLEQKARVRHTFPNVTFTEKLAIEMGERHIEILNYGRGVTPGDAFVYLPNEKILLTGDLLDHPVPYMFGGFPVDFVDTLHKLAAFNAQTIVPGHGDILHDSTYILLSADLMKAVNDEVQKEINEGKTEDEIKDTAPEALDQGTWRSKFAGDNREDQGFFDQSFTGLVKASYRQLSAR